MQSHDWNALKYVLALHRFGRLTQAARQLKTSDTTVARQVRSLETDLGVSLFLRSPTGRFEATDACQQILAQAEVIEAHHLAIAENLSDAATGVSGTVRISSVPVVVNAILVPNVQTLLAAHPNLTVELVPGSENLDLSKREADLAIRFAQPKTGGHRIKAQKLGALEFDIYRAAGLSDTTADALDWITYEDAYAMLPQARWLAAAVARDGVRAALRVADIETAREATAQALGKTLLPRLVADADPRLCRCSGPARAEMPKRALWMLSHADQGSRASVSAVKAWVQGLPWTHTKPAA
ncbi:MAG: LysR family transcriptional regulator [Pseudomonadota bacterium]